MQTGDEALQQRTIPLEQNAQPLLELEEELLEEELEEELELELELELVQRSATASIPSKAMLCVSINTRLIGLLIGKNVN